MPRFPPESIGRPGAIPYQLPGSVVVGGASGPPAWATSTAYKVNQLVTNGGNVYICTVAHTSGATFSGESGDWLQVGSSASLQLTDGTTTVTGVTNVDFTAGATVSNGGTGISNVSITPATVGAESLTASSIAYASTITPALPSAAKAGGHAVYNIGTLTAAITINNPSGTPVDGQLIRFRLSENATGGFAITWGAQYAFGTDITAAMVPTAASTNWEMLFGWSAGTSTWRCLALARGF